MAASRERCRLVMDGREIILGVGTQAFAAGAGHGKPSQKPYVSSTMTPVWVTD